MFSVAMTAWCASFQTVMKRDGSLDNRSLVSIGRVLESMVSEYKALVKQSQEESRVREEKKCLPPPKKKAKKAKPAVHHSPIPDVPRPAVVISQSPSLQSALPRSEPIIDPAGQSSVEASDENAKQIEDDSYVFPPCNPSLMATSDELFAIDDLLKSLSN